MKFKAKIKGGKLMVKAKLSLNEVINEDELEIFGGRNIRGFLKPCLVRKKVLIYSGPIGIPLGEYLKRQIDSHVFFALMAQITDVVRKSQAMGLFSGNLLLDPKYAYINENTREIQFIYMPVTLEKDCGDVLDFMESIACQVRKSSGQELDFLTNFVYFFRSMEDCHIQAIEDYISREDQRAAMQIRRQARQNTWLVTGQSGSMSGRNGCLPRNEPEPETTLLDEEPGTMLLDEEGQDTMLLTDNMAADQPMHYPSLYRVATDDTISISNFLHQKLLKNLEK